MGKAPLLTAAQTAQLLGISTASVRNWLRHGYLTKSEGGFRRSEVQDLLDKIRSGKIQRLGTRANKKQAVGTIYPESEYRGIYEAVTALDCGIPELMYLTALRQLCIHGLVENVPPAELLSFNPVYYKSTAVLYHMKNGFTALDITDNPSFKTGAEKLLSIDIPKLRPSETDLSGMIYQAIRCRGERSVSGSFYTPVDLSNSMIRSALGRLKKKSPSFLDPCCGTGQFLLSFITAGGSPDAAYGMDSDPVAAFSAATNIFLECPNIDFQPKIFTCDSLLELPQQLPVSFDLTATNPPWGACNSGLRTALKQKYPAIKSDESFSYFISRALELTKPDGFIAVVLPESITNVKRHSDIREFVVQNGTITGIKSHGRVFKSVYTPVISMEMKKETQVAPALPQLAFNININSTDSQIIDKLYSVAHSTLKGHADWALGIVTGDNKRFLTALPGPGLEPIIRGSEIITGEITPQQQYISFEPDKFQQTAPEWKYRAEEKLVYRFISKHLVFAVDRQKRLTLNSANILLPRVEGISAETLMHLLNSELYNFIFMKRFNSVKVLRSHLEQLPLIHPEKLEGLYNSKEMDYIKNC